MTCRVLTPEQMLAWCRENVRIDQDTGCWVWAGAKTSAGYPIVRWNYQTHTVRRLTIELERGTQLGKRVVYATCDCRQCVNPAHLRVGARKIAGQENAKKGCYPRGASRSIVAAVAAVKRARLPVTERHNVLQLRAEGWSLARIGRKYGVSGDAVGHALKTWDRSLGPVLFLREAA